METLGSLVNGIFSILGWLLSSIWSVLVWLISSVWGVLTWTLNQAWDLFIKPSFSFLRDAYITAFNTHPVSNTLVIFLIVATYTAVAYLQRRRNKGFKGRPFVVITVAAPFFVGVSNTIVDAITPKGPGTTIIWDQRESYGPNSNVTRGFGNTGGSNNTTNSNSNNTSNSTNNNSNNSSNSTNTDSNNISNNTNNNSNNASTSNNKTVRSATNAVKIENSTVTGSQVTQDAVNNSQVRKSSGLKEEGAP